MNDSHEIKKRTQHVWYRTDKSLNGVVLTVHGLNLKPDRMYPIVKTLNDIGYDCLNLSLYDCHESCTIKESWLKTIRESYELVALHAGKKNVDLYFAGFSLGCLLLEYLISSSDNNPVKFKKGVFFAPALALRMPAYMIKMSFFLSDKFIIPSIAPANYRKRPGTPVGEYRALVSILDELLKKGICEKRPQTIIFLDKGDELVSYSALSRFIKKKNISGLKLETVNCSTKYKGKKRHLIIDAFSLGESEWSRVEKIVKDHFSR